MVRMELCRKLGRGRRSFLNCVTLPAGTLTLKLSLRQDPPEFLPKNYSVAERHNGFRVLAGLACSRGPCGAEKGLS